MLWFLPRAPMERRLCGNIRDGVELVAAVNAHQQDYNHVRPHEALTSKRPFDVHTGRAPATSRPVKHRKTCQVLDAGQGEAKFGVACATVIERRVTSGNESFHVPARSVDHTIDRPATPIGPES